MKWLIALLLAGFQAPPQAGAQPPAGPEAELNYLRETKSQGPLKLAYFVGRWKFDWDVPDSVFGPGGEITGTETYTCSADGTSCESDVKASGPSGPFTQHVQIAYNDVAHEIRRTEKDSRGFEIVNLGRVSGDQGLYQIAYNSSPFTYKGQTIQFKTTASLTGPAYRLRVQISVDGGPFESFGNPWWRKDQSGSGAR
jgi:hypothetical protein